MPELPHTRHVASLLAKGNVTEARRLHNEHLQAEFKRAQEGETINLTDLMAAKEAFHRDQVEKEQHGVELFENAQQARARLIQYGFYPLIRLGKAEHFVRGNRRVTLSYLGEKPGGEPLESATGVFFVPCGEDIICDFE